MSGPRRDGAAPKWSGLNVLVSARKSDVPDTGCAYPGRCVTARCTECGHDVHHDPAARPPRPWVIVCDRCVEAAVKSGEVPADELGIPVRTLRSWGIDWRQGRPRVPGGQESARTARRRRREGR